MSTDFSTPVDPTVPARIWPASETSPESGKKRTKPAKRPAPHSAPGFDAPFAAISIQPVDAPAWPIHPVCWFQPEPAAVLPSWNGLAGIAGLGQLGEGAFCLAGDLQRRRGQHELSQGRG